MDLHQLRSSLENIAIPPTPDQIKDLETKLGIPLSPELIQLLKETNGGEFVDNVRFHSANLHLDVGVRGLLRIQDGHLHDFASFVDLLGDHDLDCSLHLPIFYTFSSNLFVLGTKDHRVKFWRSDYDELIDLGMGLAEFVDALDRSS